MTTIPYTINHTPMPKPTRRQPRVSSDPYPYRKPTVRIPREISSAATLWLDFFQQFCEITMDTDRCNGVVPEAFSQYAKAATERARVLADHALTAFQERFPGVHP